MKVTTDVDIDVFNRESILDGLECVYGRINRTEDNYEKHPTGVYFQNMPRDPFTNISLLDHKDAGNHGYFKIDFLNVNMYEGIKDERHLLDLLDREPLWEFFEYEDITDQLFHLNGHSKLLKKYKPRSVEDIAIILAIIRPSKSHLRNEPWDKIKKEVWEKNIDDSYQFRRSHAIAYSLAIIVNLNLLLENMSVD